MKDIYTLYLAISAWIGLGVIVYVAFVRMQLVERDTKFPQEEGVEPEANYHGRGGWNGARAVRNPFARLSLYGDFFVAGFKTQRIVLPYSAITKLEPHERSGKTWLLINATDPETDKNYEMYFLNPEIDAIQKSIESKR
ncbi:MAG: hypothetical protein VCD00_13780 [Candidatus Hydrogenedentota bacterium]